MKLLQRRMLRERWEQYRYVRGLWLHNLNEHRHGDEVRVCRARSAMDSLVPALAEALTAVQELLEQVQQSEVVPQ